MSPESPTKILTASNLRTFQSIGPTTPVAAVPFTANNQGHNTNSNNNSRGNLVLSTIPAHAIFIQQPSTLIEATTTAASSDRTNGSQRVTNIIPSPHSSNSNSLNHLGATVQAGGSPGNSQPAPTSFLSTAANISGTSIRNNHNKHSSIGNMPASSKYVFVQQNGNGQYTAYDGSGSEVGKSGANSASAVGNIVLLSSEPLEMDVGEQQQQQQPSPHVIAATAVAAGDNDEELRPLNWLNDMNLIKDINAKRNLSVNGNICIINASNAHELIEELPHHVAGEEHVATTTTSSQNVSGELPADTQITTLSVSDYQQQFIASNSKHYGGNNTGKLQAAHHVYGNIPAIGGACTTTVHVGPSGTTTVVEYKTNSNFVPNTQRQLLASGANHTATSLSGKISHSYVTASIATVGSTATYSSAAMAPTPPAMLKQLPSALLATSSSNNANSNHGMQQGQQQPPQQQEALKQLNGNGSVTTTHHPNKKYLREKMNVLVDHGGGCGSSVSPIATGIAATGALHDSAAITIVSSPASSTNSLSSAVSSPSLSSSSSTSSSTGAVNGGNSPVSKNAYYPLSGIGVATVNSASGALNYTSTAAAASGANAAATTVYVNAPGVTAVTATSAALTGGVPTTYTIVNQGSSHLVNSSPAMSSPEQLSTKEYYAPATPQQLQHSSHSMRSPTSYSSYDNDSLKDFDVCTQNSTLSSNGGGGARLTHQPQQQPQSSSTSKSNTTSSAQKQKHPNNYDPLVHTHNKPPYSFSSLIFMAIEGSTEKALPVKEIYAWIVQHFPYFKTAPTGWKNSVRHNLSLNKSFVKVEKAPNMGKGSLWRVEQQQRPNLIQALTRSPLFPNSAIDKSALKSPSGASNSDANSAGYDTMDGCSPPGVCGKTAGGNMPGSAGSAHSNPRFDPRYFPNLSKAVKDMAEHGGALGDMIVTDAADDDMIPSDYSTITNYHHHSANSNSNRIANSNCKKYSYSLGPSAQNGGGGGGTGTAPARDDNGLAFSIERLTRDCGADSMDDVNAAAAMLALKHGPKVFTETFQNGTPVITSSPSEDHTYSAGGSGASTPLINGNGQGSALNCSTNASTTANNSGPNGCTDNQSNCASSDAAYESSEENHNHMSQEELNDRQRHRDGVDALLSLSLSTSCSPIKRPASTSPADEDHLPACHETNGHGHGSNHAMGNGAIGKMALLSSAAANAAYATTTMPQPQLLQLMPQQSATYDEGYHTQSYYGSPGGTIQLQSALHHHHNLSTPSPPKRPKPCRSLRPKFKRKAAWTR